MINLKRLILKIVYYFNDIILILIIFWLYENILVYDVS